MLKPAPCRLGRLALIVIAVAMAGLAALAPAFAAPGRGEAPPPPQITKAPPEMCALLDDPLVRGKMDALLMKLLLACGRDEELGQVRQESALELSANGPGNPDVQVNDSSGDAGGASHTQSETAIVANPVTGTLCSGFNDSYHGVVQGQGFTGFSRSTDGGATWTDGGPLGVGSGGDPSIVWREADGNFYFAALHSSGLGVWSSSDDCQSFSFVGNSHVGAGDDKELMAVENNSANPHYGRLYMAWTDFSAGGRIFANYSDDGGSTWSSAVGLSSVGADTQGAWPAVAPNGDVYVAWLRWNPFPSGPIDVEIVRSTDGGDTWSPVTDPMTGKVNPRDSTATGNCGRPAIAGNVRYLPSPQIAVGADSVLHVVYSYDPDGFDTGDVVDVFYRRSTDNGATWGPEVRINDDATTNDQYFPTLSVGDNGIVSAAWYDRRLDAGNVMIDYFQAFSYDGGVTWEPNIRLSDVSTPVFLDPSLATCYHGDYDQQIQTDVAAHMVWADDRNVQDGHNDPDVFTEAQAVSTDFLVTADPRTLEVCAPDDAVYTIDVLQFQGFSEAVTLATSGEPAGTTTGFAANPLTPPDSTTLTVSGTGGATAGSYDIVVTGTSSPSAIVHDTTVGLSIFDQTPGDVTLTAPGDGAVDVDLRPTLEWTAGVQATAYDVEIATDAGFSNVVQSATVTTTSYDVDPPLDPVTTYFWRVRGTNVCGDGSFSTARSFTTRPIPPILFVDDDDNNPDARATYIAALDALGLSYDIWDTGNSDNEPDAGTLGPYEVVVWETGDEFGGAAGPGSAGEAALGTWLDAGGCLFISSQDYHFDRGLTPFMDTYLGLTSVTNDTTQTSVTGGGTAFTGLGPYGLTYPFTNYSDTFVVDGDAEVGFTGNQGNAGANKDGGSYRTVFLGFPLEAIPAAADREAVLSAVLDYCDFVQTVFADGFESGNLSAWSATVP